MMDKEEYAEKAVNKIYCYHKNEIFTGDKLILSFETGTHPLNQKEIMLLIEKHLR